MDLDVIIPILGIISIIVIWCIIFGALMLVAGFVATTLGLTGVMWWAMAIVIFLLLTGFLSLINRSAHK